MLKLKFDDGKEYSFSQSQIIIGRVDSCDLIIAHESISRNHAKIIKDAQGHYCLGDLASANGTYINNEELLPDNFYRIENGDILGFGDIDIEATIQSQNIPDHSPASFNGSQEHDEVRVSPISVQDLFSIGSANVSDSQSLEPDLNAETYSLGQELHNLSNIQGNAFGNQSLFGYSEATDIPPQPISDVSTGLSDGIPNIDELQEKLNLLKQKTQASSVAAPLGLNLFSGLSKNKNEKADKKVNKELSEEEFLQQMGFSDSLTYNASAVLKTGQMDVSSSSGGLFGKSNSKPQANKNNSKQMLDEINEEDLLKQFESFSTKKPLLEALSSRNLNAANIAGTSTGLTPQTQAEQSTFYNQAALIDNQIDSPAQAHFAKTMFQNLQGQSHMDNTQKNSIEGTLSQETLQELASKLKAGTRSSLEGDNQGNNFGKISQALKSTLFGKK